MTFSNSELELLSPAKSADIGIDAFRHGADAVYIGGPAFGARQAAGNSFSDIARLTEYAHRFRGRVLMTLNTILRDDELEAARKTAWDAWNTGVDALIVQDMGLLECDLPPIQLHASTQCDIRTPEKAKFLEDCGFSQIVPARELSLPEIRAISESLTRTRIEFFIHGALCVSYSGQCYASEALRGRSANRGACAQICRLPFDAILEDGTILKRHAHLLSLKDNCQVRNLGALIEAGVRSFKIEGRLKDADYVKNITAYYRKAIDAYLEKHPEFAHESDGDVEFKFEPDPEKTFNRGSTEYFVNGRIPGMSDFGTPKNAGRAVGTVRKLTPKSIVIRTDAELHNGDGLTYFDETGELKGLQINRAEPLEGKTFELFLRDSVSRYPGLKPGLTLLRNRDQAWSRMMSGETAERRIPITVSASFTEKGVSLTARDPAGTEVSVSEASVLSDARDPEKAFSQIRSALSKFGDTDFRVKTIRITPENRAFFVPVSVLNRLRRELASALGSARKDTFAPLCRDELAVTPFPAKSLDYRGNVCNQKARHFYESRGTAVEEPAYEAGVKTDDTELMRCRYCIRHALGLCPKEAKKRGERIVKPEPIRLIGSGGIELTARFHCGPCEMSIHGKRLRPGSQKQTTEY